MSLILCVCVCVFQHWDVFKVITEVFILVPALVGLKGNLEMTLASRLSTAVSLISVQSQLHSVYNHTSPSLISSLSDH